MTDERSTALSADELDGLSAEELPDRKAMSTICPPGDEMGVVAGEATDAMIPPAGEGEAQPTELGPGAGYAASGS